MDLRTRLSRSNGYRELGMYDESILELEEIEGEDRWHPSVVEARYKTYRDDKERELAMTMARVLAEGLPDSFEWLKKQADVMTECGDPSGALQLLHDSSNRFGEDAQYIFALGRQYALLGNIEESKKYLKRAIIMDSSLKTKFLDDPAFDEAWFSISSAIQSTSFFAVPERKIIASNSRSSRAEAPSLSNLSCGR